MLGDKKRFVYMILVGVAASILIHLIRYAQPHHKDHSISLDYLISIVITILVWEGNLYIDWWMNKKFPWVSKPGKRVLLHLPISMVYSATTIYVSMLFFSGMLFPNVFICKFPEETRESFMLTAIIIGLLVSIILLSVEVSVQFFRHWKSSMVEVEKYKSESLQAQFQNLKSQINPHFLFNNLSVLSSLVYQNQDKSVEFINQLAKVYRYLLDNNSSELVTLNSEITFIKSYTYLLKIRFDKNISFDFQLPDEKMNCLLPPMALQALVENAIKHNEVSSDKPLSVSISVQDQYLIISNNLQLRTTTEASSKTGLKNIIERYHYFTEMPVKINKTSHSFEVKIPLVSST